MSSKDRRVCLAFAAVNLKIGLLSLICLSVARRTGALWDNDPGSGFIVPAAFVVFVMMALIGVLQIFAALMLNRFSAVAAGVTNFFQVLLSACIALVSAVRHPVPGVILAGALIGLFGCGSLVGFTIHYRRLEEDTL